MEGATDSCNNSSSNSSQRGSEISIHSFCDGVHRKIVVLGDKEIIHPWMKHEPSVQIARSWKVHDPQNVVVVHSFDSKYSLSATCGPGGFIDLDRPVCIRATLIFYAGWRLMGSIFEVDG